MATTHLISGLPCAGKTTYANELKRRTGAVCFTLDYWLITSYGAYAIEAVGHAEHVRRVLACRELIWSVASEFLRRGVDVILDDGFFLRQHRMRYVAMAKEVGVETKIHFLDTPLHVLQARLEARNARLHTYNFRIESHMLDVFLSQFEVPSADEGDTLVVVNGRADEGSDAVQA